MSNIKQFADVGSHCDMSTCRQQDFLPFRCDTCAGVSANNMYFIIQGVGVNERGLGLLHAA